MKKLAPWLAAVLLCFSPAAAAPQITAKSYILMDAETGAVLAEKNADTPLPPASLTKIFAVYLLFAALADGRLTMEQQVLVSQNAWAAKVEGSKMFIEVGSEVSLRDLLYGVIVQSGNDASVALAEALSGDEAAFAEEMTAVWQKHGATNSQFQNATGLPAKNHHTTARDVALAVRRTVADFPEWYAIYAEPEFTYNGISQPNRNRLLSSFDGADGVKTGYTKKAGYCLAASAEKNGQRMIAVVMQTKSPRVREQEAAKLMRYGFNHYQNIALFSADETRELPLWEGTADNIAVRPAQNGVFTVKRGDKRRAVFRANTPLIAPIQKGDVVGEIEVLAEDGEPLKKVNVVAAETVPAAGFFKRLKDDIRLKVNTLGVQHDATVLSEW